MVVSKVFDFYPPYIVGGNDPIYIAHIFSDVHYLKTHNTGQHTFLVSLPFASFHSFKELVNLGASIVALSGYTVNWL